MRLSRGFIPTLKEDPAGAEVTSHRVMLKGGMVRLLAAGVYSYLPFLWKSLLKAQQIIREEMNAIGGQEFLFPALNPIDLWDETGRNDDFGDDVFRLKDRKGRGMLLAPTHEEVVSDIARNEIRSYRDLPQIWYQIQTKFRDEPRPRSGLLRSRQFIMKDSYTLDTSQEGLDRGYDLHALAYRRLFARCGLKFFVAGASSGLMGGTGSQEFLVESKAGEDRAVVCDDCGYVMNLEVAATRWEVDKGSEAGLNEAGLEEVHTPDQRTIEDVSAFLSIEPRRLIKSLLYLTAEDNPVMFLVPGSHDLNEGLAVKVVGMAVRPAEPEEVTKIMGAKAGFIGPVKAPAVVDIYADSSLQGLLDGATGANRDDYHLTHISLERDVKVTEYVNLRVVREGEACVECGSEIRIITAIEMGHIFKLGTKYSESMGCTFQDEQGEEKPIVMGSYGIGLERIAAAAMEQSSDDDGICWPASIAPYHVYLLPINVAEERIVEKADDLYEKLQSAGLEVLYDDRNLQAGTKFKDADLLGLPFRVNVGMKGYQKGVAEVVQGSTREMTEIPFEEVVEYVYKAVEEEIAGYNRYADEVAGN